MSVVICKVCEEFFAKFSCRRFVGECDCPKCQGMCQCKSPTKREQK